MNAQQKENMVKLIKAQEELVNEIKEHKQGLINLIVEEETTSTTKVEKITMYLLKAQLKKETVKEEDVKSISEAFSSNVGNITINEMVMFTEFMKKVIKPSTDYQEILDSIAEIIRTNTVTDDMKVSAISKLLI